MGKVILCTGNITDEAYLFPDTNTRIYSIEEMCYYIYHNIYSLSEADFTIKMADWIKNNLLIAETSEKLKKMIRKKGTLKDMVVTVLCSADFYEEDEIKQLIRVIDKLETCSLMERKKLRGDNFLKGRDYKNAAVVYYSILKEEKDMSCSKKFLGDILHNLGIIKMNTSTYEDAAKTFQRAYEKNKNKDSLLAYLMCIKFAKKDDSILKETTQYKDVIVDINTLLSEIEGSMLKAETIEEFQKFENSKKLKNEGKMLEYYEGLERMITQWKDEYKNGLI
ncbi:MAG: hypothetical protein ACERKN_08205 [Velocimicrobium sp.]